MNQTKLPSPVLILTNQLHTGGAEIYVLTVARWLTARGVHVEVAAAPGELVSKLDAAVRYHAIDLKDQRLGIPLAASRVRRVLHKLKPQVILTNSLITAWVGRLAATRLDIPVVNVAHGWPAERYKWISMPMAVADRVVPVSHDVARRLIDAGLPLSKSSVVHNGIDLDPFHPRTAEQQARAREVFGASSDDVVVSNIGRYTAQKSQHIIVEIARRLVPEHPNLKFGIIGWGPREAELRALIAQHGLESHVRLLIKRTDVPDLLMASDIYLSTSDWEGMPLSMIEAMAASLPIVTTNVEGMSALVSSENSDLVPIGDIDGLTASVGRLASDEVLRLQRGSVSRMRAETKFSKDVMCANLASVLSEVVAS